HEAVHESHYASPEALEIHEGVFEDETFEGSFYNPEGLGEDEDETFETFETYETYETAEDEGIFGNILGGIGAALGLESPETYETYEWEDEADPFIGKALRKGFGKLKGLAGKLMPVAKMLAPMASQALSSMIPGGGMLAKLAGSFLKEGQMEAMEAEAQFFGHGEINAEVGSTEAAYEAALTELLAHEAVMAETESEAEAVLATTLPITITIMGGRRALRPVMPAMAQANGRLVRVLRRQGPAGRRLLRTVPAIQRQAVGTIRAAARAGQPITTPLAVKAMAASARNVLNSPRQVQRAVVRNAILRQRVAPPT